MTIVTRLIAVIYSMIDGPRVSVWHASTGEGLAERGIAVHYDDRLVIPILPWSEVLRLLAAHATGRTYSWVDDDGAPIIRVHRYGRDGDEHAYMIGVREQPTILVSSDEWDRLIAAVGAVTVRQVSDTVEVRR